MDELEESEVAIVKEYEEKLNKEISKKSDKDGSGIIFG